MLQNMSIRNGLTYTYITDRTSAIKQLGPKSEPGNDKITKGI
jgi:hypothetical protein